MSAHLVASAKDARSCTVLPFKQYSGGDTQLVDWAQEWSSNHTKLWCWSAASVYRQLYFAPSAAASLSLPPPRRGSCIRWILHWCIPLGFCFWTGRGCCTLSVYARVVACEPRAVMPCVQLALGGEGCYIAIFGDRWLRPAHNDVHPVCWCAAPHFLHFAVHSLLTLSHTHEKDKWQRLAWWWELHARLDLVGMRLLAGGTKGSALCGALHSTPPVELANTPAGMLTFSLERFVHPFLAFFGLRWCNSLERLPGRAMALPFAML